ncbi:MAG: ImmA/IrrE family metallo-endopeptidase [Candidatus Tectomicrobia bacterium]|nr:ImmA/IrrE family metallo-endopeptidase [Candidatus Tectomicrobia bacterium]
MRQPQQEIPRTVMVGERIHRQRTTVGMTVAQLAKLIGVNRNTLTNYESGKTEPTASDLVRIADALGCDIIDLLAETPSVAPRFAFRAHAVLHNDPQITVIARKYLRAYREIEEMAGKTLPLKLMQFPFSPQEIPSNQWIKMAATKTRESCGIRDCGPENITYVLESLGVRCLFFYKGKGLDGLSVLQDDMSLVMLRDRNKAVERIIFSGAHELGHLTLHPHLFTTEPNEEGNERDYEAEANLFAGYFLVPSDDLIQVWEEEGLYRLSPVYALLLLKQVFRVSFWCLYHRVQQEGLVQLDYPRLVSDVKRLLGIREKAKMEDLEPDPLPPKMLQRSTRFARLVYSAFIQEKIGIAKVAEMFQITVDEAKRLTAEWMTPKYELVEPSAV